MGKRKGIDSIIRKRFWQVMDFVGDEESRIDEEILKLVHAPKLDEINKKKLGFPKSFFPLKNAPSEWWYFTGHLKSGKRRMGFEYCMFKFHPEVFRIGPVPLYIFRKKPYLVLHQTLTDKDRKKFYVAQDSGLIEKERISYDKLDISLGKSRLSF